MKVENRFNRLSLIIWAFFLLMMPALSFAANPGAPIQPGDNIQDPGDPGTPWGGCGPSDSNCYVTVSTSGVSDGDKGDIVVSGSGANWNIDADVIDWDNIADATTLDAPTSIALGANNLTLNLNATGDFVIQDNGTPYATFTDDGKFLLGSSSDLGGYTLQVMGDASIRGGLYTAGLFTVTTADGNVVLGDFAGDANGTFFALQDDNSRILSSASYFDFYVLDEGEFRINDDVYGTPLFLISSGIISLGDYDFNVNGTNLIVNDIDEEISINSSRTLIGVGSTKIEVNDNSQQIGFIADQHIFVGDQFNMVGGAYGSYGLLFINTASGDVIIGDGVPAVNGTFVQISDSAQSFFSNALTHTFSSDHSAATADAYAFSFNNTGTFNTTSGALTSYGGYFYTDTTRSSGSNNLTNVALYASATGAQRNYAAIFDSGFVGIGNTAPTYALDVKRAFLDTDIFALTDSDGLCLHNPEAGSEIVSCSSDERLKANIRDAEPVLSYFNDFVIRDYTVRASGDEMTGVIAQEVLLTHPELVTQGVDGLYSVQLPSQWKLVKAIQELDLKIESIERLTESTQGAFLSNLRAWFANAANGIEELVAGRLTARRELCINTTCVTEAQLQELLRGATTISSPASAPVQEPDEARDTNSDDPEETSTSEAPVLETPEPEADPVDETAQ